MKGNFNVDGAFFVIDSDNLKDVQTKFYGYCITENGIIENVEDLEGKEIKPEGAYIYIYKSGNEITIKQDYIGAYGLYLYKDNEYFAISNSFMYLVDYIKKKKEHKITFNKKCADAFINSDLCSLSYSETLINEIEIIDRNAIIIININKSKINISFIDYKENTVDLDSSEGIEILDRWYYKWCNILHHLKINNKNIIADLSGGFDSRLAFNLLLGSKINLNDVLIHSATDNNHTHKEDYEIAKSISEYYKFTLNDTNNIKNKYYNYNEEDILNISFYLKAGFHKQMYFQYSYNDERRYSLSGFGGECIRNHWNISKDEFIKKQISQCSKICDVYSKVGFGDSIKKVLEKSFQQINEKFEKFGRKIQKNNEGFNLYREVRCRNHLGKQLIENFFGGCIKISPLIDSELYKLKLNTKDCDDENLLITLIFLRYNENLLNFNFEGNRAIDSNTIEYARILNSRFKISSKVMAFTDKFYINEQCAKFFNKNDLISKVSLDNLSKLLLNAFNSEILKNHFIIYYNYGLLQNLADDICIRKHHPLQNAYVVIAITKIIQDVILNINNNVNYFADFVKEESNLFNPKFLDDFLIRFDKNIDKYITARIDIKNTKNSTLEENDIEIIRISDNTAAISTPEWFHKNGKGYVIESRIGILNIVLRCINKGNLTISLRGQDVRDKSNNRVPILIDYSKFIVNSNSLIEGIKSAWHDEPIRYNREVDDGEIINLSLEWKPHNFKL